MNKEQQELIYEGLINYHTQMDKIILNNLPYEKGFDTGITDYGMEGVYNGGDFVDKCRTDSKFSEKWGLKVKERELSLGERGELFKKIYPEKSIDDFKPGGMEIQSFTHQLNVRYNNANIPVKLITVTYKDKTITSYE